MRGGVMLQTQNLTDREKMAYKIGVAVGIRMYAWWKDGQQYVGTSGKLLDRALQELAEMPAPEELSLELLEDEHGHESD